MLSRERRASAAATQKQCEANQNFGEKQFSSPFFHTNTSQSALTCSAKPFVMFLWAFPRSLKITPSYDLSLPYSCVPPTTLKSTQRLFHRQHQTLHSRRILQMETFLLVSQRPNVPQYWKDFRRDGMVFVIPVRFLRMRSICACLRVLWPRSELPFFRFAGARGRVNRVNQDPSQRKHESRIPWLRLMFMTNINRKKNSTFLKATTCNVKHVISR